MRRPRDHELGRTRAIRGPAERLRRLGSVAALLSAATVVVTTVAFNAAAAPSSETASPTCLTQGARHVEGTRATTTYAISQIRGVTCAFAKPWVSRITHLHVQANTQVSGGPPGWYCGGSGHPLAWKGACAKTGGYFYWQPVFAPTNPNANLRVYDMHVVGSATATYKDPLYGHVTLHWVHTVLGLRIRVRTVKFASGVRVIYITSPSREGTGTVTAEWSPANIFKCPEHVTNTFVVHTLASIGTPWISIDMRMEGVGPDDCTGQTTGIYFGGAQQSADGVCRDGKELCFTLSSDGTGLGIPTGQPPRPLSPPLSQIVHGKPWTQTVHDISSKNNAALSAEVSVRVTLTPRRP